MALYIVTDEGKETTLHIPFNSISTNLINSTALIQADGDELDVIQRLYKKQLWVDQNIKIIYSIPMPQNKRVIRWYGDIAKTILANL